MFKEAFDHFWRYTDPDYALTYLDTWMTHVLRTRIKPMAKLAGMLRRHRQLCWATTSLPQSRIAVVWWKS